jgi:hypothetical protein
MVIEFIIRVIKYQKLLAGQPPNPAKSQTNGSMYVRLAPPFLSRGAKRRLRWGALAGRRAVALANPSGSMFVRFSRHHIYLAANRFVLALFYALPGA